MLRLLFSAVLMVAVSASAEAGVVNEAHRNGPQRIAPGSIVLVSAAGPVGPATAQVSHGFPLTTNLAGTSARIVVGDATVNAYVLAAEFAWVRLLVPSRTPLGDGHVIVSYNGRESPPQPIRLVARALGLFDGSFEPPAYLAPSFRFPRLVQNAGRDRQIGLNSFVDSAKPGEFVVLWGTGLGAASGDEAAGPLPGDLESSALTVFVGDRPARVLYAGRSGCCAGMDQIIFEMPTGIQGCNVPVWVRFSEAGHGSNEVFVSVSSVGNRCSDEGGLSEVETGAVAAAALNGARITALEDANGDHGVMWTLRFGKAAMGRRIPFGTCATGWSVNPFTFEVPAAVNAGTAISIQTPETQFSAERTDLATYQQRVSGRLNAGDYTFDNAAGGPGVGRFRFTLPVPERKFTWTNQEALQSASISEGVTVLWTAESPEEALGYVTISAEFEAGGEMWGTGWLTCYELADKGRFTISPTLLARLASDWLDRPTYPGANSLVLSVGYAVAQRADYIITDHGVVEFTVGGLPRPKRVPLQP